MHILDLGGTISSVAQDPAAEFYKQSSVHINDLLSLLPINKSELPMLGEQYLQQSSHEITHDELLSVAKRINELAADNNVRGIVVSQGTNCIEEIAYFINLVVKTKKRIVFTGSFRPLGSLGYDGSRNLYNAILLASNSNSGDLGVVLTFNGSIVSAREAIKLNPSMQGDFSANGSGLLGDIQGNKIHIHRTPQYKHTHHTEFDLNHLILNSKIFILYGHLGIDNTLIEALIDTNPIGIISAGMGTGYQPRLATDALIKASNSGIFIVRCSRSGQGNVNPESNYDDQHGFIAGGSLTPQKARILLFVALSKTKDKRKIQEIFDQY